MSSSNNNNNSDGDLPVDDRSNYRDVDDDSEDWEDEEDEVLSYDEDAEDDYDYDDDEVEMNGPPNAPWPFGPGDEMDAMQNEMGAAMVYSLMSAFMSGESDPSPEALFFALQGMAQEPEGPPTVKCPLCSCVHEHEEPKGPTCGHVVCREDFGRLGGEIKIVEPGQARSSNQQSRTQEQSTSPSNRPGLSTARPRQWPLPPDMPPQLWGQLLAMGIARSDDDYEEEEDDEAELDLRGPRDDEDDESSTDYSNMPPLVERRRAGPYDSSEDDESDDGMPPLLVVGGRRNNTGNESDSSSSSEPPPLLHERHRSLSDSSSSSSGPPPLVDRLARDGQGLPSISSVEELGSRVAASTTEDIEPNNPDQNADSQRKPRGEENVGSDASINDLE